MRDANLITDLTFEIEGIKYSVIGVYLTPSNHLYVKLKHPINKCEVNFPMAKISEFVEKYKPTVEPVAGTRAFTEHICPSLRPDQNL